MFRFAQHDKAVNSNNYVAPRRISDYFFGLTGAVIELWLLFPIVTQIEPVWVCLFDKRNFPAATPTLQFLLARDRITNVMKVLNPNESI